MQGRQDKWGGGGGRLQSPAGKQDMCRAKVRAGCAGPKGRKVGTVGDWGGGGGGAHLFVNSLQLKASDAQDIFHTDLGPFNLLDLSHPIDGPDPLLQSGNVSWRYLHMKQSPLLNVSVMVTLTT